MTTGSRRTATASVFSRSVGCIGLAGSSARAEEGRVEIPKACTAGGGESVEKSQKLEDSAVARSVLDFRVDAHQHHRTSHAGTRCR